MTKSTKAKRIRAGVKPELSGFTVGEHNVDEVIAGITRREREPEFIVVDLFCGAGGTSTGFEMTDGRALVIACVNHDFMAIKSHWLNHPHIAHFEEDIRTLKLAPLVKLLNHYRKLYPNARVILWASLECTNFSKAKGGQPRDADSRTLADHLDRYIKALNPDYVQIENVVEFMSWGPLDDNGKPVSRRNGSDYMRWCNYIDSMGYYNEWRELNSADFGAYTSRNRLFGCFAKHGLPIAWPEPTHAKKVVDWSPEGKYYKGGLFDNDVRRIEKWKAVKDVLDFEDQGTSIFDRKKALSDKTLERIYAGLIKYVAGGKDKFLLKYNSTSKNGVHVPPSVDEPCPVIAAQNRLGVVQAAFIQKNFSGRPEGKVIPVDGPAGTITTSANQSLVQAFIAQRNTGEPESKLVDINGPARTLTATGGNQDLVMPRFITCYNGNGGNSGMDAPAPTVTVADRLAVVDAKYLVNYNHSSECNDINNPAPTLLTRDKIALVQPKYFIARQFTGGGQISDVNEPVGSLLAVPKTNLVTAEPFIMATNFDNKPSSIEEPLSTITANRKWHYLVNPSHGGNVTSTDAPCPVIVARQDKAPLYMVISEGTEHSVAIRVDDNDTAIMVKIKEFMVLYSIVDIKMRMLKVIELLKIQDFPADYKLEGNQSEQKKFIGNSVVPRVVSVWCLAMADKLTGDKAKAA
jgi:DNA (cytosine-5)-methyltransferase 1